MSICTALELSSEIAAIAASLDFAPDGEIPDEVSTQLDMLSVAFEEKTENICKVREATLAEAVGVKAVLDRLEARHGSLLRRADWLKAYTYRCMVTAGMRKLKTPAGLYRLSVCKNSRPSIALEEGAEIPEEFRRVTITFDSQRAYEAWKAGKALPACVQVVEGEHLRIA